MLPPERERVQKVIESLNAEWEAFGVSFRLHEGRGIDTYSIVRTNKDGSERVFGFTKMGESLPIKVEKSTKWVPIEEEIEARLRFPDLDAAESLERLAEFKRKEE